MPTPVAVSGAGLGSHTIEVAEGQWETCAVKTDQSLWCWGDNTVGELGTGVSSTVPVSTPEQVIGMGGLGYLTGTVGVAVGARSACALRSDGTVSCWGWNADGQDGNGTYVQQNTPVQVLGVGGTGVLTGVVSVVMPARAACALRIDGTLWCWGTDIYGLLGNGNESDSATPVQVMASACPSPACRPLPPTTATSTYAL